MRRLKQTRLVIIFFFTDPLGNFPPSYGAPNGTRVILNFFTGCDLSVYYAESPQRIRFGESLTSADVPAFRETETTKGPGLLRMRNDLVLIKKIDKKKYTVRTRIISTAQQFNGVLNLCYYNNTVSLQIIGRVTKCKYDDLGHAPLHNKHIRFPSGDETGQTNVTIRQILF